MRAYELFLLADTLVVCLRFRSIHALGYLQSRKIESLQDAFDDGEFFGALRNLLN